ncbi:MAG: hypothetical protein Q8O67_01635 [Deltaproteobacteria bacterium]|nr:hypothetical protein [Deltaproteobacteria bacterium]
MKLALALLLLAADPPAATPDAGAAALAPEAPAPRVVPTDQEAVAVARRFFGPAARSHEQDRSLLTRALDAREERRRAVCHTTRSTEDPAALENQCDWDHLICGNGDYEIGAVVAVADGLVRIEDKNGSKTAYARIAIEDDKARIDDVVCDDTEPEEVGWARAPAALAAALPAMAVCGPVHKLRVNESSVSAARVVGVGNGLVAWVRLAQEGSGFVVVDVVCRPAPDAEVRRRSVKKKAPARP